MHQPDRLPPHAPDAERGVIGCILTDPTTCLPDVQSGLSLDDLYDLRHRKLLATISDVARTGRPVDLLTLSEALRAEGQLEAVGGIEYLNAICDSVPSAANLPTYLDIVREKAALRRVLTTCVETLASVYEATDHEAVIERFERDALAIRGDSKDGHEWDAASLVECVKQGLTHPKPVTIRTGLHNLDRLLRMRPGQFVVFAARPSQGKSALANEIALWTAVQSQVPTEFVSLEMSREEVGRRFVANLSRVPQEDLEAPDLQQRAAIVTAFNRLKPSPLRGYDGGSMTPGRLAALARRWKQRHRLELLIVDYLGLMRTDSKARSRYEMITEISGSLKAIARDLGIVVIALAQLNREACSDDDEPRMHHLRDSGAIEQDADAVVLLHTTSFEGRPRRVTALVEKQRGGPVGEASLTFDTLTMKWDSVSPIDPEDVPA